MKTSHLIQILAEQIRNFGDGEIYIEHPDGGYMGSFEESEIQNVWFDYKDPSSLIISVDKKIYGQNKYIYKITDQL